MEDESIVARDIQNMLERLGSGPSFIALSGGDALKKAKTHKPDLVLMDIKLHEDMDGIECARRIQSLQPTPVVYFSALSDESTMKRARATQPFFFIPKPIVESELKKTILEVIAQPG